MIKQKFKTEKTKTNTRINGEKTEKNGKKTGKKTDLFGYIFPFEKRIKTRIERAFGASRVAVVISILSWYIISFQR